MPRKRLLIEARARVISNLDEGVECPCCGQWCKLYRRKFNSGMARIIIWLVKTYEDQNRKGWINVPEVAPVFVRRSNEVSRLCLWKLAQERDNEDPARRNSGMYRPTKKGWQFVRRRITIPSHVHVFNNEIKGWSDTHVDIVEALGEKFHYQELMRGHWDG